MHARSQHGSAVVVGGLVASILLGLSGVEPARAQPAPPFPQPQQTAQPAIPVDTNGVSQVFPNGFPEFSTKPDNGAPPLTMNARVVAAQTAIAPAGSDYLSSDLDPRYFPEERELDDLYDPVVTPLPDYYYQTEYYEEEIGARPIADYAPPGYEPRDYQSAPGVPEFTPITAPPRIAPEDAGKFVTRGLYPGSFLVPGVNTSFRLRGFVRLAALYDFDPIGSTDSFVTNAIPVPQQEGENFNMSGRISRFALESWTPTSIKEWNVHTFIEGDFFNGLPQAAGGGGNPFRLRHAFVDFGYFRFGQQNTVFMDGTNWPSLVDFQGPNSWVNQRQPSARMTLPVAESLFWATSIERPFSDVTTNGLGTNVQDVPDMATHLRFEGERGHIQVAALFRSIGFRPAGDEVTRQGAVGVSGSVVFHPWAMLVGTSPVREANPSGLTRSRILLQCSGGPGVGRYINDLAGQGFDGQVDPLTGEFELVDAFGWNASYEHYYSERWLSNFTYANVGVDNNVGQPLTTYDSAQYMAASLWWLPIPRMSIGIEYIRGQRDNLNGQSAETDRVHGLFQYNF